MNRRRARRLLLPLAACALTLSAAPVLAAPAPETLTLRLPDLGPGYFTSNLSCKATHLRGDGPRRVADQIGRRPHQGCEMTFFRVWIAPGAPPGPEVVSSRAFVFDDVEGPALALTRPRAIASFMYFSPRRVLKVVEPAPAIGDEAVLLRVPELRLRSGTQWDAIVLWRSGNVLAAVETTGVGSFDAVAQAALHLAAAQQARIAAPTPLSPADTDQAEVGLNAPDFGLPLYWLGKDLPARGRLPGLSLIASVPEQFFGRDTMTLGYGRDRITVGVTLRHSGWLRHPLNRGLRQIVASDPCTRRKRVVLPQGRATIWSRQGRGCAPRGIRLAIARLPGLVVTINVDARRGPAARYATRAGMLRLLRALRPHPPAEPLAG